MKGQDEIYGHANETAARVIAYLGPYLFWGTVGTILGGFWLLQ